MSRVRVELAPAEAWPANPIARAARGLGSRGLGLNLPRALAEFAPPPDLLGGGERAELARSIEGGLTRRGAPAAALAAARRLAEPGALAVVAGQQPGFLGGPLYNVWKALHAVVLARELERAWSRPVVALFWCHADDHDLAEVHHAWLVNQHFDLRRLGLPGLSSGRTPIGRLVLSEEQQRLGATRAAAAALLGPAERSARWLDAAFPRDGETLAAPFARLFDALFGGRGLIVLEPEWIRPALSAALARVLRAGPPARPGPVEPLLAGARRLRELGFEAPIEPLGAALLFRLDERGRSGLRAQEDGRLRQEDGVERDAAEIAGEVARAPLDWSPGALLRPLAQDLALPVAAYVGGAGELAYHAELDELRTVCGAPRTAFVARFSATIVDAACRASLERLELSAAQVIAARGEIRAASDVPAPPVIARLRGAAEACAKEVLAARTELAELDAGLAAQLKQAADHARQAIERVCEKAERVQLNRAGKGQRHARRLAALLAPRGEPQERVLCVLQALAWHGTDWLDELAARVPPLGACGDHQLISLAASEDDAGRAALE